MFFVGPNPVYDADGAIPPDASVTVNAEGWAVAKITGPDVFLVVEGGKWRLAAAPSGGFSVQVFKGARQVCFSPVCVPSEGPFLFEITQTAPVYTGRIADPRAPQNPSAEEPVMFVPLAVGFGSGGGTVMGFPFNPVIV